MGGGRRKSRATGKGGYSEEVSAIAAMINGSRSRRGQAKPKSPPPPPRAKPKRRKSPRTPPPLAAPPPTTMTRSMVMRANDQIPPKPIQAQDLVCACQFLQVAQSLELVWANHGQSFLKMMGRDHPEYGTVVWNGEVTIPVHLLLVRQYARQPDHWRPPLTRALQRPLAELLGEGRRVEVWATDVSLAQLVNALLLLYVPWVVDNPHQDRWPTLSADSWVRLLDAVVLLDMYPTIVQSVLAHTKRALLTYAHGECDVPPYMWMLFNQEDPEFTWALMVYAGRCRMQPHALQRIPEHFLVAALGKTNALPTGMYQMCVQWILGHPGNSGINVIAAMRPPIKIDVALTLWHALLPVPWQSLALLVPDNGDDKEDPAVRAVGDALGEHRVSPILRAILVMLYRHGEKHIKRSYQTMLLLDRHQEEFGGGR